MVHLPHIPTTTRSANKIQRRVISPTCYGAFDNHKIGRRWNRQDGSNWRLLKSGETLHIEFSTITGPASTVNSAAGRVMVIPRERTYVDYRRKSNALPCGLRGPFKLRGPRMIFYAELGAGHNQRGPSGPDCAPSF